MIGRAAIRATISGLSTPAADRPKNTSAPSMISASVRASRVLRVVGLLRVHGLDAARVDHALAVGDPDVLAPHAQADHDVQAGDRRGAGARADQLDVTDRLADHAAAR